MSAGISSGDSHGRAIKIPSSEELWSTVSADIGKIMCSPPCNLRWMMMDGRQQQVYPTDAESTTNSGASSTAQVIRFTWDVLWVPNSSHLFKHLHKIFYYTINKGLFITLGWARQTAFCGSGHGLYSNIESLFITFGPKAWNIQEKNNASKLLFFLNKPCIISCF